jgi:hypothetical protein
VFCRSSVATHHFPLTGRSLGIRSRREKCRQAAGALVFLLLPASPQQRHQQRSILVAALHPTGQQGIDQVRIDPVATGGHHGPYLLFVDPRDDPLPFAFHDRGFRFLAGLQPLRHSLLPGRGVLGCLLSRERPGE